MGKIKRNRIIKPTQKSNSKILSSNKLNSVEKAYHDDHDSVLKPHRFEIKSPKVKIDWSNPYEQDDLDYNIIGWEQGIS
jgi:hypothetical protein